ncbi:hypothetical protein RCH06_001909 [Polaromonas sp. CG_9.5]|nr:hypothetical protein [Polaromonas sp. CG_9.5]
MHRTMELVALKPICNATKKKTASGLLPGGLDFKKVLSVYMWSIITWPKPEQLTCVAPSMSRAKS